LIIERSGRVDWVGVEFGQLAPRYNLNVSDRAALKYFAVWYTNGFVDATEVGTGLSTTRTNFSVDRRSSHIHESSPIRRATNPGSVELAHLYWMSWPDLCTAKPGLIVVALLAGNQCILIYHV